MTGIYVQKTSKMTRSQNQLIYVRKNSNAHSNNLYSRAKDK